MTTLRRISQTQFDNSFVAGQQFLSHTFGGYEFVFAAFYAVNEATSPAVPQSTQIHRSIRYSFKPFEET